MQMFFALVVMSIASGAAATGWADSPARAPAACTAEVRCPVMGEIVGDTSTAARSIYKGRTYYFCCPACKPKFDADPERYAGDAAGPDTCAPPAGVK